jgi:hypothetical protein
VDILKMLSELRAERAQIEEVIIIFERSREAKVNVEDARRKNGYLSITAGGRFSRKRQEGSRQRREPRFIGSLPGC